MESVQHFVGRLAFSVCLLLSLLSESLLLAVATPASLQLSKNSVGVDGTHFGAALRNGGRRPHCGCSTDPHASGACRWAVSGFEWFTEEVKPPSVPDE